MDKRLLRWLTAIATDSRVLADYQDDPAATMARFGLSDRDFRGFLAGLRERSPSLGGVALSAIEDDLVTH